MGRPKGSTQNTPGFQIVECNRKYLAICQICFTRLKNTAKERLLTHRKICERQHKDAHQRQDAHQRHEHESDETDSISDSINNHNRQTRNFNRNNDNSFSNPMAMSITSASSALGETENSDIDDPPEYEDPKDHDYVPESDIAEFVDLELPIAPRLRPPNPTNTDVCNLEIIFNSSGEEIERHNLENSRPSTSTNFPIFERAKFQRSSGGSSSSRSSGFSLLSNVSKFRSTSSSLNSTTGSLSGSRSHSSTPSPVPDRYTNQKRSQKERKIPEYFDKVTPQEIDNITAAIGDFFFGCNIP